MKYGSLMGAIIGDTVGSVYEFNPTKDYNFAIETPRMEFTDDTVMTLAVAKWILEDPSLSPENLVIEMQALGRLFPYPLGGYGGMFFDWLMSSHPHPYNSWGNGSAMRVTPVGFAFDTLERTLEVAATSASVSHNHPEGIKGAQATAAAIFLARTGSTKDEIQKYITDTFGYDLSQDYDDLKATYHFEASCQETVPQSIIAFLKSHDFEDAIRLTVALGGDADTMGAITGGIAAAYYRQIPARLYDFSYRRMPQLLRDITDAFQQKFS